MYSENVVTTSANPVVEPTGAKTPADALGVTKRMSTSESVEDSSDATCPTCGRDDFDSRRGMKYHHALTHGESLSTVTLECGWCGSEYEIRRDEADRSRYCSVECNTAAMQTDAHPNHTQKEVPCSNCGDSVVTTRQERMDHDHHYCDEDCQYEGQTGEGHHSYNSVEIGCEECGTVVKRPKSQVGSMGSFCSHECYAKYLSREWSGQGSPLWRGGYTHTGSLRKMMSERSWRRVADEVRQAAGRKCEKCGSPSDGKKLDVHHIVPLVAGGTNGSWNLMALCDSCHNTVEAYTRDLPGMEGVLTQ